MTISPLAPAAPAPARGGSSRSTSDSGFGALVEHHLAAEQANDPAPRTADNRTARAHVAGTDSRTTSSSDSAASPDAAAAPGAASGPGAGPVPPAVTARSADSSADSVEADTEAVAEGVTVSRALATNSPGLADVAEAASSPAAEKGAEPAAAGQVGPSTDSAATGAPGAPVADGDAADAALPGAARAQQEGALAAPGAAAVDGVPHASHASGKHGEPEAARGSAPATGSATTTVPAGEPTASAAHQPGPGQEENQTSASAGVAGPSTSIAFQQGAPVQGHAAAGAAASSAAADPQAAQGSAVTAQVFDHVTRLVSRGDGTHRMMLRLHPADLGEVKVVLTVRNNTVDVTLSAGPGAREALRDGSPQLRALLELTGATTGQLVVRDHAHAGSVVPSASTTWTSGQQQGGHGSQAGQQSPTDSGASLSGESGPGGDGRGGRPSPGRSDAPAFASVRTSSVPAAATARVATARLDLDL